MPRQVAAALAALASILATTLPVQPSSSAEDRITRRFAADDVRSIAVTATVGQITITGWSRPEIVVEVERRTPTPDAESRVPVTVTVDAGVLRVAAGQLGTGRDPRLVTDVTLRVPTLAKVGPVDLFEGRITIEGLAGQVRARVERGRIAGDRLGGQVRLETVSGDIGLTAVRLDEGGLVRCRTFNGSVTVRFAEAPADARILALTLNGVVTSTLPLSERGGFGPRFREATIGRGTRLVSIDVVRGDIAISAP